MRVLYVDDDRINSLLFEETCRVVGESVALEVAANGAEALEVAERWQPELLVIDLHLPDTNGYALLGALRQCLRQPDIPAYLCTADEPSEVESAAQQAGFTACWTKPVRLQTVIGVLNSHGVGGTAAA